MPVVYLFVHGHVEQVADHLTAEYARWIAHSRFCILSTIGPDGTDGTPRGDDGPVVTIADSRTLLLPDWSGNNRTDSLRNIVSDPRLSLLFMVVGSNNVVRVNGSGKITVDKDMLERFGKQGKRPRSVLVVTLDEVYYQCAKAVLRAGLWREKPDLGDLPTAGDLLAAMTNGAAGGAAYDRGYEARAMAELWVKPEE